MQSKKNIAVKKIPAHPVASQAIRAAIEGLERRQLLATITVTTNSGGIAVDGAVSLNEAIASANANAPINADVVAADAYGTDTINFLIPSTGQVSISDPALPAIIDTLIIDGYSQPGATVNTLTTGTNASPLIRLVNSPIVVQAPGSSIRGLALTDGTSGAALAIDANNVTVGGNFIGTADGTTVSGNITSVAIADNITGVSIGGVTPADRNLISGNSTGIQIDGDANTVRGNLIGTNAAGNAALLGTIPAGTLNAGVAIIDGERNIIGGATAAEANVIAFNSGDGVATGALAAANVVTGNSIYGNGDLGLDLRGDGVSPNDPGDIDIVQNAPVLSNAERTATNGLSLQLQLAGRPSTAYKIDLYSNTLSDASGSGEGQTYLGSTTATSDGAGKINTTLLLPYDLPAGTFVTATVLDPDLMTTRGTSEFSNAVIVTEEVAATPVLAISNVTKSEGDSGTTSFTFTVTRTGTDLTGTSAVDYMTADGTATVADNDYVDDAGTLTFAAGETSKTVTVAVNGDTKAEGDEKFAVILSAATGATISATAGTGTGNITNDDGSTGVPPGGGTSGPALSVNDVTQKEGDEGTCLLTFVITRTGDTTGTSRVNYTTASDTAVAGRDFVATSGTLTFAAGETSKTVDVTVKSDSITETDESLQLVLSNPVNATLSDATGVGTIANDDYGASLLSIDNVKRAEGNSGLTPFTFTVHRSGDTSANTLVYYTTANGSAKAGSDYVAQDGTITFLPGETSKTVTVQVRGDTTVEADEYFRVRIGGATNAGIADNQAVGMITDDDRNATSSFVRINDVKKLEGNSGKTNFTFTVTRSGSAAQAATVAYQTLNGTAKAGSDFVAHSGTVTFAKGERVKTVTIKVNGDTTVEPNESFKVQLSNATNAIISDNLGIGRILNDDDSGRTPGISINDVRRVEGDSGLIGYVFGVSLDTPTTKTVTVKYRTQDDTAHGDCGCDFQAASGTVTLAPGEIFSRITIYVKGETKVESDEQFLVKLSNATNAKFNDSVGIGTIVNDD